MVSVALPAFHKIGCLMDNIIDFLVHIHFMGSMSTAKLFAEIALMGTDFARVLRPTLLRWKQVTKHDRALIRQVNQRTTMVGKSTAGLFFGFHDMWILEFALGLSRGDALSFRRWMSFPMSWMTSIGKHHVLGRGLADRWLLGLSITECLSPHDKKSLSALCWFSKYTLHELWKDRPGPDLSISVEPSTDSDSSDEDESTTHTDGSCASASSSTSSASHNLQSVA